jgi:hypothetical protein
MNIYIIFKGKRKKTSNEVLRFKTAFLGSKTYHRGYSDETCRSCRELEFFF